MADDGILKQLFGIDWLQHDPAIQLLNQIDGDDVIDRLVVLMRNFNSTECEGFATTLRLSGKERKEFLFRHSKLDHIPEDMDSSIRIYAAVVGTWSHQHLQIEKLFAAHEAWVGDFSEEDVQRCIDRLNRLKIDFDEQPLASGDYIMQQTNMTEGPKLGALKAWLFYEQIARNLQSLDEIDRLLCTLSWQTDDASRWPKLQFP